MTMSIPRLWAACSASYTTAPGSPPSGPETTGQPARSPQMRSWSIAAARKVSAAASNTFRPSWRYR